MCSSTRADQPYGRCLFAPQSNRNPSPKAWQMLYATKAFLAPKCYMQYDWPTQTQLLEWLTNANNKCRKAPKIRPPRIQNALCVQSIFTPKPAVPAVSEDTLNYEAAICGLYCLIFHVNQIALQNSKCSRSPNSTIQVECNCTVAQRPTCCGQRLGPEQKTTAVSHCTVQSKPQLV
jgi:hypothetical protein